MSPRRRCPKRKSSPATTTRAPMASRYSRRELLGLEPLRLERELDHERVLDAELGEELEPPLERAEELDPVAEHPPWVRVEGDDRRREPGLDRLRDHPLMAAVDAVEHAERDRALLALELRRGACDIQTGITTEPTATSRPSWVVRVSGCGPRAPGPDRLRLAGVHLDRGKKGERLGGGQDPPVVRVVHGERPDLGAAERLAVAAERIRDRPHVRPGADPQVEARHTVLVGEQLERVDPRPPHRHRNLLAAAVQLVGALAVDLHRRGGGHAELDLAAKSGKTFLELLPTGRLVLLDDLTFRIAGRGAGGEVDLGGVALVETDEPRREPGRRAGEDDEQTRCERVERARVPGARARPAPDRGDHLERRRAGRLVGQDEPGRLKRARWHRRTRRGRTR